jgi:hypothetical protein
MFAGSIAFATSVCKCSIRKEGLSEVMEDTPYFTYDPAASPCRAGVRPHREVTCRLFEALCGKAKGRGWTLSKPAKPARPSRRPIRYVLNDNHGLLYFRSLEEVERHLRTPIGPTGRPERG